MVLLVLLTALILLLLVPPCRTGSELCTVGGSGSDGPPRFKQTVPTVSTIQAGQTAYLTCEIFCVNNRSVYTWQRRRRIKNKDRREGKCSRWWLGDVLEWCTNNLAARMIKTNIFGRTSIMVGWWFGMVWTGWSFIFPKHPFRQLAVILFILYLKSSWWKKVVWQGIESYLCITNYIVFML